VQKVVIRTPIRGIAASPDGRTLYYGAQIEANIWKVEQPKVKQ